ncbi:amino acid racemase [Sphingosinicellaceae bacterium]|nr:amino acid racemase [Sphingosinicellaceae bacterium]
MMTVGVMGGMGPAATLDFLQKLHAATPATGDEDHLRVLTDSDPRIPGRNAALRGDGPSPFRGLVRMACGLVDAGAELLAMPCNAAHVWAGDIQGAVDVPFVSMIDAAADVIAASGAKRVGVLAADATLRSGLYRNALASRGVGVIDVDPTAVMPLIMRIKSGDTGPELRAAMAGLAAGLVAQGADTVLAACTEVPLVLGQGDVTVPFVDATAALVGAVLARALVAPVTPT